jgi:threonine/homoserine/homoserine lactone efflux protein
MEFFLKGFVIGFSIASPVGPIGVLCIKRSLHGGGRSGFATGLGAATADALYGCVAGFGLTAISSFLVGQKFWLGVIGGLFLCYLGLRTFISNPSEKSAEARGDGISAAYLSTFILTLTNPVTILSFVAVFAGIGLGNSGNAASAIILVAGVFCGSAAWWLLLSFGAASLSGRITPEWIRWVNRVSGSIILAFGVYALCNSLLR